MPFWLATLPGLLSSHSGRGLGRVELVAPRVVAPLEDGRGVRRVGGIGHRGGRGEGQWGEQRPDGEEAADGKSRAGHRTSQAHAAPERRTLGRGERPSEGPGHRPCWWRGQAADAADRRPRQTRGAVRRHLPPDRLRALQRRQLRLPPDRRADAVQVAQPRPSHHPDLADVDAARQLRGAGAGAAARRQALVPRLGRRDLPVAQPDQGREARHRRRGGRRPRLPDGLLPDGRPARRQRGRVHGRGDPSADRPRRPVRRHRRRARRPAAHPRVPREADRPDRAARQPRARCSPRWATTSSTPTRWSTRSPATRRPTAPSTTWAATSCPPSCVATRPAVYDYQDNVVPGATDRDRGYWRDVGTLGSYYAAHMDVVSPLPIFNLYNFDWPIYTSYGPQPPAKVVASRRPRGLGRRGGAVARGRRQRRPRQPLGALARRARRRGRVGRRARC